VLSVIISCGTVAGALIPEFTKIFVSTNSRHVKEITNCSRHGGASLNILSGLVAGDFSAFWMGLIIMLLMAVSYFFSQNPALLGLMPAKFLFAAPIFGFGLVAFGFLGMGPVTIAVDSYGPVTDNAQSVYELSQIEGRPGIAAEIEKTFGFKPDFEKRQVPARKGRRRGQHVQGDRQACAHRHGSRRRNDNGLRHHNAAARPLRRPGRLGYPGPFKEVVSALSIVQPEIILGLIMVAR